MTKATIKLPNKPKKDRAIRLTSDPVGALRAEKLGSFRVVPVDKLHVPKKRAVNVGVEEGTQKPKMIKVVFTKAPITTTKPRNIKVVFTKEPPQKPMKYKIVVKK